MIRGETTLRRLLAPFDKAFAADDTREVVVNRCGEFAVEGDGGWTRYADPSLTFGRLDAIGVLAMRMTSQTLGPNNPTGSSRLPDGQRITVTRPPMTSPDTVLLTIRQRKQRFTLEWLHDRGYFSALDPSVDWVDRLTRWVAEDRLNVEIVSPTQGSKAQPMDSLVLTPTGWRRMGDIKIGDTVVCPDGKASSVIGVYPQGKKQIYRVSFQDGRTVECCDDHLWKVWRANGRRDSWVVAPLSDIRAWMAKGNTTSKRLAVPVVTPLAIEHPPQDLPIPPYAMGVLLGDGCFRSNNINLSSADPEILERVLEDLPAYRAKLIAEGTVDYRLKMKVQRKVSPLRKAMADFGLMGLRSDEKFLPAIYKSGSVSQRLAVLQGLLDTDGNVSSHGAGARFASASRRLAEDVRELVWSLGGIATIVERESSYRRQDGTKVECKRSYGVNIIHEDPGQLFSLPRKVAKCYRKTHRDRLRIVGIDPVGEKEAQCIRIDHPDHLYITDGYVVTHNTSLLEALCNAIPEDERPATVESAPELFLPHWNWVPIVYDPSGGARGAEAALETILRQRPDRIIFGETRTGETWGWLRALNTGHRGCMSTTHGNPGWQGMEDALVSQCRQSRHAAGVPQEDIRRMVRDGIQVLINTAKTPGDPIPYRATRIERRGA